MPSPELSEFRGSDGSDTETISHVEDEECFCMLLHKNPRDGGIPKHKLLELFDMFNRGQWEALSAASGACCSQVAVLADAVGGPKATTSLAG